MSKTYAAAVLAILVVTLPALGIDIVDKEVLNLQIESFISLLLNAFIVIDRVLKRDISWLGLRK